MMKKNNWTLVLLFISIFNIQAQVTFVIDAMPVNTPENDLIFIAGDFTGWEPGNPAYVLDKNEDGKWSITLSQQDEGTTIQYKFTRGDWNTVEKGADGEEIGNRIFVFGNDTTVHCQVLNWADQGGGGGGSTAAENVSIMDEAFYIPQLDRSRRIWIYLPPDYQQTTENYPVLYMHDGQNLFDSKTSFSGEWEVDETLNEFADIGYKVPIVVGIDNGGSYRIDEYTPWIHPSYGGGQGDDYINFIVETLKPFIDANYRTLPDQNNTGLMGSSLGGLISFYGAMKHQDVFGKAGLFSTSYWFSDSVWTFTTEMGKQNSMLFYQIAGQLEVSEMAADMNLMESELKGLGFSNEDISSKVIPNGDHNEALWRQEFGEAYLWLFVSFANDIAEKQAIRPLIISPNPVVNFINLPDLAGEQIKKITVVDSSGKTMLGFPEINSQQIDVTGFPAGYYIIKIVTEKSLLVGRFVKL